jgi:hypothetical protein
MSRAATLAMICSSSCDSANIAVSSPHSDSHSSFRMWSPAESQQGKQI